MNLKINVFASQDYYSQTLIVQFRKLKLKMSIKIAATTKKCLTLVTIQLSQNIKIIRTN